MDGSLRSGQACSVRAVRQQQSQSCYSGSTTSLHHHSTITLLPLQLLFSVTPSLSSSLILLPINRLQRAWHMSARGGGSMLAA